MAARYGQYAISQDGLRKCIPLRSINQVTLACSQPSYRRPTQVFSGGYFALPTNSGDHTRNTFAVVPEVAFNLGYRLAPQATVYVSYSFLYASNVARPGEQINRNMNPTQSVSYGNDPPATLIGAAQPTFNFNTTDFWAQTLSIGMAYRF